MSREKEKRTQEQLLLSCFLSHSVTPLSLGQCVLGSANSLLSSSEEKYETTCKPTVRGCAVVAPLSHTIFSSFFKIKCHIRSAAVYAFKMMMIYIFIPFYRLNEYRD